MIQLILRAIGRFVLGMAMLVLTMLVGALAGVLPFTSLIEPLETDFVHASWIKPAAIGCIVVWFSYCSSSLFGGDQRISWRYAARFLAIAAPALASTFWIGGFLIWFNAHGTTKQQGHVMRVLGTSSTRVNGASSTIDSYRLQEIGTDWRSELELSPERDGLIQAGDCVKIVVREGRLGADWISDARPIRCPRERVSRWRG